ncbi:MAG: hypothetical protein ACXVFQ_22860 [Solirubrobacteraceae bacterium]
MSRARPNDRNETEVDRVVWERAMRQLGMCTRLLAAVLVALGARLVISGPTPVSAVAATIIAGLLLAALLLTRQGRRHQPGSQSSTAAGRQSVQSNTEPRRVSRRV